MPKVRIQLGLALGCLLMCSVEFMVHASELGTVLDKYSVRTWNEDDGLPYHCINSMTQTRDGYLWFGTFVSAVRFDGIRFKVFDSRTQPELPEGVNLVYTDRGGALWAGMPAGLGRLMDGVWEFFGREEGWPGDWPRGSAEDSSGNLYFCAGQNLVRFAGDRFVPVAPPERGADTNSFFGLDADQSGVVWVRGDQYLGRLEGGEWQAVLTAAEVGRTNYLMGMAPARDGGFWVANMTEIRHFNAGQWDRILIRPVGFTHDAVRLLEDARGNLWMGCYQQGVVSFRSDGSVLRFTAEEGLLNNSVLSLFEDSEGHIWIGTNGGGLAQLKARLFRTYGRKEGLTQPLVNCLLEEGRGHWWVGTHGGGLFKFDQSQFKAGPNLQLGSDMSGNWIYTLAGEQSGVLWVGALEDGLYRIKDGQAEAVVYTAQREPTVGAMLFDSRGRLWFGSDDGVYCRTGGTFTHYGAESGLDGLIPTSIAEDNTGGIWVADGRRDRALFQLKGEAFERYPLPASPPDFRINALYHGSDSLWLAANSGRLGRIRADRYTEFLPKDGLPDFELVSVVEDNHGDLWLGTDKGIVRVTKASLDQGESGQQTHLAAVIFGRSDGLRASRCRGLMQPNCAKGSDGRLWFATLDGVAVVDPGDFVMPPRSFSVRIEEVFVDGRSVNGRFNDHFRIAPDQEQLAIQYTALTFGEPDRVRFRFRVEGLDHKWTDAKEHRVARFSHLPPGRYCFRVMAENAAGIRNEQGAALEFIVEAPWWRTGWFYGFCLGWMLLTGIGWQRFRHRRLERAHAMQRAFSQQLIESQEAERKRIAFELHDSLGQSLLVIRNRASLGLHSGKSVEALRAEFDEIARTAKDALEEVRGIARSLRPQALDNLGLTQALRNLCQQVVSSGGPKVEANIEEVGRLLPATADINLFRIAQEGLSNVMRHAKAARIRVTLQARGGCVCLTIEDDGCGFDPHSPRAHFDFVGSGLMGMAERARLAGATLRIQSQPGSGTRLVVEMPVADLNQSQQGDKP